MQVESIAAIVTGGASGLGFACAKRFLEEGARVSLWDANSATLAESKNALGDVHAIEVDVCNHEQVAAAAKRSREALGSIDILVNSAGITGATVPVHEFPIESWLRVLDVNLNGVFYCCREIAPVMIRQRYGRIINVASVAGKEGNPNASAYSASKGAVRIYTKSAAVRYGPLGVRVNSVHPGYMPPMLNATNANERGEKPIGRTIDQRATARHHGHVAQAYRQGLNGSSPPQNRHTAAASRIISAQNGTPGASDRHRSISAGSNRATGAAASR